MMPVLWMMVSLDIRCTVLQIFHRLTSGTAHSYPMKSEKQVGQAFEDHAYKVGTPVGITSDDAKLESHGRMKDILCLCSVDNSQSETHYQHQNQAKQKSKTQSRP